MDDVKIHSQLAGKYLDVRNNECYRLYYEYWHQEMTKVLSNTDSDILECGCGTGELLSYLERQGVNAIGFDLSLEMVQQYIEDKGNVFLGDMQFLPFSSEVFDAVICKGSLHHVDDPVKGLQEICRVLKKEGKVIISEPCRDSKVWKKMALFYTSWKSSFAKNHKNFDSGELKVIIGDAGLKILRKEAFGFIGFLFLAMPQQFSFFKYLPFSKWLAKGLIKLDTKIASISFFKKICWHNIIVLTKQ